MQVRIERSGFRDDRLKTLLDSENKRWAMPLLHVDFLGVEYDQKMPKVVVAYTTRRGCNLSFLSHVFSEFPYPVIASYHEFCNNGLRFTVRPLNKWADKCGTFLSEVDFVGMLYQYRNRIMPDSLPFLTCQPTGEESLSERHRLWGYDCPVMDLDFLLLNSFDLPVAFFEFKMRDLSRLLKSIQSERDVLHQLSEDTGLPWFSVFYTSDYSRWIIKGGWNSYPLIGSDVVNKEGMMSFLQNRSC